MISDSSVSIVLGNVENDVKGSPTTSSQALKPHTHWVTRDFSPGDEVAGAC
jgi:hypothetical protein